MIYYCLLVLCLLVILCQNSGEEIKGVTLEPEGQENYFANKDEMCRHFNMWFVPGENATCHCGSDLDGIVQCDTETKELSVLDCYCITRLYTEDSTMVPVVGKCIINCGNISSISHEKLYHAAPSNCQDLNRQGTLCGRCLDGYALPAYSYDLKCMKCESKFKNVLLYITYAFLPLTVFIVIILVFRINVVAPNLYLFVFAAQTFASPILLRIVLNHSYIHNVPSYLRTAVYLYVSVYGVWNLDFFRVDVLPPICINVIPLQTLALDYLVAIYPMLLMGVAYIIVELHACGFRPVLYMWRPFHRFFARFRRTWGIQTSIMDAFVTFFVLSTTKLYTVSFVLLVGTRFFTPNGQHSWHLYYDPHIKYFGNVHLPYALMAIAVLFVFNFFPLSLLLCYQFRIFHKCLTKCRLNGPALDMYVNSFQQYYKDGSNGTLDCRWFAGFFLIIRIATFSTYVASLDELCFVLVTIVFTISSAIVLIVQPFKEEYNIFNMLTTSSLLLLALFFATIAKENLSVILAVQFRDNYISSIVISLLPLIYVIAVVVHHFYKICCSSRFKEAFGTVAVSSLPHRLLHSDQYRDRFGFIPPSPSLSDMATQ